MKIILKNKIKKLGNIGDVVEVKDGYGRNMLIPNGFALFYTDKNYETFKLKKEELERENQEKKKQAEDLQSRIAKCDIILIENAGDDGKLYGSISGVKLATFINSLLKIDNLRKTNISLKEAIKEVGRYIIDIELHPEVFFEKEIIIARSLEEAKKIKKGEKVIEKKESKIEEKSIVETTDKEKPPVDEVVELESEIKEVKSKKKVAKVEDEVE